MFGRLGSISQQMRKAIIVTTTTTGGITLASVPSSSKCSGEDHIPALDYGWSHHGALASFDYKAIRRGFQV